MKSKKQIAGELIGKITWDLLGAAGFFFLGCLFLELIYYAHDCSYADRIDRIANWSTFLLLGIMGSGLFLLIRRNNEDPRDLKFLSGISDRHGWYLNSSRTGGTFFVFTWPIASMLLFLPLLCRRIIHLRILRKYINETERPTDQSDHRLKEADSYESQS